MDRPRTYKLIGSKEWAKHLKPDGKRKAHKRCRRDAKRRIRDDVHRP